MLFIIPFLSGLGLLLCSHNVCANTSLTEYHAEYTIQWKGIVIGTSKHSFYRTGSHHYRAQNETQPILPLLAFQYFEDSDFTYQSSQFHPSHFAYLYREHGKVKNGTLRFDWVKQQALHTAEPKLFQLPNPHVHDKVTYLFQLRLDLKEEKQQKSYTICTEKGIKNIQFKFYGNEILKTRLGEIKTVIFEQKDLEKQRSSMLWLAKNLDYLPIKFQQFRKGRLIFEGIIKSYRPI